MPEPLALLTGLAFGESPRWHDGRLWFSNWGAQEVVAVDLEGRSESVVRVPTTIPFCIDWLPDGRLLVVSGREGLVLRQAPMWSMFEAVAPTLVYDATAMGGDDRSVPVERAARVTRPTLVMNGTVIPFMLDTATRLAQAIPHAQRRTLEGQSHDVDLKVLAPALVEFFTQ
jgi:hypothetical protein